MPEANDQELQKTDDQELQIKTEVLLGGWMPDSWVESEPPKQPRVSWKKEALAARKREEEQELRRRSRFELQFLGLKVAEKMLRGGNPKLFDRLEEDFRKKTPATGDDEEKDDE